MKILNQLLIFMNLYQYKKIQEPDWSRAFWSICLELDFSQISALKDRMGLRMKNFDILGVH